LLVRRLWLTDFRSYHQAEVALADGVTAILGPNGQGKTNLLEALGYLASLGSFRGAPPEALIRAGASTAFIRAEGETEGRQVLIEAEVALGGRGRVYINKQRLQRSRDLLGVLRVSVFSPDDLELVKGAPSGRRRLLDDTLVSLHPRYDQLRSDVERVLRQRNTLLKQCAGGSRFDESASVTLGVWDTKFAESGEALAQARRDLVDRLGPQLREAYSAVAGLEKADVDAVYEAAWLDEGLGVALARVRKDEVRRGVTLVGPHRDDLGLKINGLPARTHASQGEQRSLALALRLAAHDIVTTDTGTAPVLLLDDVFSELDPGRSDALLQHLPTGQTVLTSAAGLPPRAKPDKILRIDAGTVHECPDFRSGEHE
jgi:DNA replication and repair protein RecF